MRFAPKASLRLALNCFIGYIGLMFPGLLGTALPPGPEETVRGFYDTLESQDCERAMQLRPDYRKEDCQQFGGAEVHNIALEIQEYQKAHTFIKMAYMKGKREFFCGDINREQTEYTWIIRKYINTKCKLPVAAEITTVKQERTLSKEVQHPGVERLKWACAQSEHPAAAVVKEFYTALANHDCHLAMQLRPGYSLEICKITAPTGEPEIKMCLTEDDSALVELKLAYTRAGQPEHLHAFVHIRKSGDKWLIDNQGYHSNLDGALALFRGKPWNKTLPRISQVDHIASIRPRASFGSATILHTCWKPEDLKGDSTERAIIKPLPIPDTNPPLRSAPKSAISRIGSAPGRSIRRVILPDGQKFIALTFDLCEQAIEKVGYDGAIVNYLRTHQTKATFFAGGKWMRSHPRRTMQLMADPLFEIGNHAWTHGNLRVMQGAEMSNQIIWTQAQYEILWEDLKNSRCVIDAGIEEMDLIPRLPRTFRFPYGACSAESLQETAHLGLDAIQWNVVSADSVRGRTAKAVADTILKTATPGSIVIAHANGRGWHTAGALAIVVPTLKKRGYEFVTVSELLALGKPVAADTCYERKPGDNKHYDRLFGNGTGL